MAFCEANGSDIHEGRLVCSSVNSKLDAKEILGKLLTSEDDIRLFCEANQIAGKDSHLFRYKFLDNKTFFRQKILSNYYFCLNF